MTTTVNLDEIRARAEAATPGPWEWYGNTDTRNIYLSSVRYGRQFVMGFERWGMQSAQPQFAVGRTWTPNPTSWYDFDASGTMTGAKDLIIVPADRAVRYEVAPDATSRNDRRVYRADIAGIRHPDAVFIAAARQDVADLLTEVERLRAELRANEDSEDARLAIAEAEVERLRAELADEKAAHAKTIDNFEAFAESRAVEAGDPDWLIWSHEHGMWWGPPPGNGYRNDLAHAGRYSYMEAAEACSRRSWRSDASPPEVAVLAPSATLLGSLDLPGLMRARIARATADAVQSRRMARQTADATP